MSAVRVCAGPMSFQQENTQANMISTRLWYECTLKILSTISYVPFGQVILFTIAYVQR